MKILLDENIQRRLRSRHRGHLVMAAVSLGWQQRKNGELLRAAEDNAFGLWITADQNIVYQQNNAKGSVALLALSTNDRSTILSNAGIIQAAADCALPNSFERLELHRPSRSLIIRTPER